MYYQGDYESTIEWKNTDVYRRLQMIFYPKVKLTELVSFVNSISDINPELRMSREEKRSGHELIKWFSDHWDEIEPYFPTNDNNDNDNYFDEFFPDDYEDDYMNLNDFFLMMMMTT